jgi:hypothetical protein
MLDLPAGAVWADWIEQASANADAFIFLVGGGASKNPHLQAEWKALLRSDWDAKKRMIPVLLQDQRSSDLPRFLANRSALVTTNFDQLVEQIERLIQNPSEGRRPPASEKAKTEQAHRLEELKDFAEALKKESDIEADAIGRL